MNEGDSVLFDVGGTGRTRRPGTFIRAIEGQPGVVLVHLNGDPFPVCVSENQVVEYNGRESVETRRETHMATATKISPKELRKQAKALAIEGWEDMTADEMSAAIAAAEGGSTKKTRKAAAPAEDAPAKRTSKKTAPAKAAAKKSTKKAAPVDEATDESEAGDNPYKPGSNLFFITEELLKGGKRNDMVKRLKKKIELKPRQRAGDDFDVDAELDRRILIVGQLLERDHGYKVARDGRGKDAYILAEKP